MAYDRYQTPDEEDEKSGLRYGAAQKVQPAAAMPAPRMAAPTVSGPAALQKAPSFNTGAQNAGSTGGSRRVSGRHVNFGTLYGLNKEAANKSAQNVAGKVSSKVDAGKAAIGAAQGRFQQGVQQAMVPAYAKKNVSTVAPTVSTRLSTATNAATMPTVGVAKQAAVGEGTRAGAAQGGPPAPGAPTNPTATDTRDDLVKAANTGYTGPDSMSGQMGEDAYQALLGELASTEREAQGLNTAGGVEAALGYTGSTGASRLDAGLTQGAGSGAFADIANQAQGMSSRLQQANAGSASQGAAARAASKGVQDQYAADLAELDAAQAKLFAEQEAKDKFAAGALENERAEDTKAGYVMQWLVNMGLPDTPENRAKAEAEFAKGGRSDKAREAWRQAGEALRKAANGTLGSNP